MKTFATENIFGENALGCPQYPYDSCPKDGEWWARYKANLPYRQRANEIENRIIRALSITGGTSIIVMILRRRLR